MGRNLSLSNVTWMPLICALLAGFVTVTPNGASAGSASGGGGHPCKLDFMQKYRALRSFITADAIEKEPLMMFAFNVLSDTNKDAPDISIVEKPIADCPHTSTAFLCSRVPENKIEIYCDGKKGWPSISTPEAYKQIMHEQLWWSYPDIDDKNYNYSNKFMDAISAGQTVSNKELVCGVDLGDGSPQGFKGKYSDKFDDLNINQSFRASRRKLLMRATYSKNQGLKSPRRELMVIELTDVTDGAVKFKNQIYLTAESSYIDLSGRLNKFNNVRVTCKVNQASD